MNNELQHIIELRDQVILQNAELVKEKRMIQEINNKLQQEYNKLQQGYNKLQQEYEQFLSENFMRRTPYTSAKELEEYPFGKFGKKLPRSKCKSKKVK